MRQNQGLDHLKVFFLLFYIYELNLVPVHNLDLSPVDGGKKMSKSGGDFTNSEQYKKDNQTFLLQVCIRTS